MVKRQKHQDKKIVEKAIAGNGKPHKYRIMTFVYRAAVKRIGYAAKLE
jgi:hypothetical protein